MGSTRIVSNSVGDVRIRPGGGGGMHVQMGQGSPGLARYVQDGKWDVHIYPYPNKALGEVLLDGRLGTIVHDYTQKVMLTYAQMLGARSSGGNGLISTLEANVWPYWGYKKDRWVGEVKIGSADKPYGAADEFGRSNPDAKQNNSTYAGSGQLAQALYSVLPKRI